MKRRKKGSNRKRKALGWCLAALGMGAVCLGFLAVQNYPVLSPRAALHMAEKNAASGQTQTVETRRAGSLQFILSENETILMVTPFSRTARQEVAWLGFPLVAVDLSREDTPVAGYHQSPSDTQTGCVQCLGIVKDQPQAVTARIIANSPDRANSYEVPIQETPNHLRYFWLCQTYTDPEKRDRYSISSVVLEDQAGQSLGTITVDTYTTMPIIAS